MKSAREVGIHQLAVRGFLRRLAETCRSGSMRQLNAGARRLDQNKTSRVDSGSDPRGDTVACHAPVVGKGVGLAQPAIRREHRDLTNGRVERRANLVPLRDEHAAGKPRGKKMRVLVHRQQGHPVRRISRNPDPAIDLAHRVGEWSAARNDQQAPFPAGRADRRKGGIEVLGVRENAAADLHDNVDDGRALRTARVHLHEIAGVKSRQLFRFGFGESESHQAFSPSIVHVARQLQDPPISFPQIRVPPGPGRHEQQSVEDFCVEAGRMSKDLMPTTNGVGQPWAQARIGAEMLAEVRETKRHMPRLILRRKPHDRRRDRIGGLLLDEPEQGQKRSFAEY
jgi:hypothetical protein